MSEFWNNLYFFFNNSKDKFFLCFWNVLGGYRVNVKYGGVYVLGSFFKILILLILDVFKVKVIGFGVEKIGV